VRQLIQSTKRSSARSRTSLENREIMIHCISRTITEYLGTSVSLTHLYTFYFSITYLSRYVMVHPIIKVLENGSRCRRVLSNESRNYHSLYFQKMSKHAYTHIHSLSLSLSLLLSFRLHNSRFQRGKNDSDLGQGEKVSRS
jgi:hypothetical protein